MQRNKTQPKLKVQMQDRFTSLEDIQKDYILLITLPHFFEGETDIVNHLFADGLKRLHLRKPAATTEELERWIEAINLAYRSRIVLHDHHELALRYELGGIHLNSRNPHAPKGFDRNRCSLSRSCHSIQEVKACHSDYDYVLLSPIYNSISKQGYHAAFPLEELTKESKLLSQNIYALGGITFEKLAEVKQLGFAGAAMLGGFWEKTHQET